MSMGYSPNYGYNPYQGSYPPPTPIAPPLLKQEVTRVHGEEGAKAFALAPNSSVLLMDETAPVVWLKTTDGASYPTITGYAITPIEPAKPVEEKASIPEDLYNNPAIKEIMERLTTIERMLADVKSNATTVTKQYSDKQPTNANSGSGSQADKGHDRNAK